MKLLASISVAISDGLRILIGKGTELPAQHKEIFSTLEDQQKVAQIHLVYGDNPLAFDNITLAKFIVEDIPLMPRGKLKIEIEVSIDNKLELSLNVAIPEIGKKETKSGIDLSGLEPPIVKYTVEKIIDHQATNNTFAELFESFGFSVGAEANYENDLDRFVFYLSRDFKFRNLFLTESAKAMEGYNLTNEQLLVLKNFPPSVFTQNDIN